MNTQKELSFDEVSREFDKRMAGADTQRAEELDRLTAVRTVKDKRLSLEQVRLTKKLGPTHPRVAEINAHLVMNAGIIRDLKLESARAHTEIPQVDPNTWVLHGFVRDKTFKGVSNLTVALYDQSGGRVNGLGHACTGVNGYFRIASKNISTGAGPVYLRVLSQENKFLYSDKNPLRPEPGFIEYREITLSGEETVCVPPPEPIAPPVTGPPTIAPSESPVGGLPPRDYWIVRGRVTDRSGKGLSGLFVNVYDKDLFFDDRLGQAQTDQDGKYSFTYRTGDFRDLIERKPDIYVKVIDRNGKTIYTSKAIWYEAGRDETIDIEID